MDVLETKMEDLTVSILDKYNVPKDRYAIFDVANDAYSVQKEKEYYALYHVEDNKWKLVASSRNIKFIFSYLILNCVDPLYKYEARKKFIDKVKGGKVND